jgi:hypothetical protein
LLVSNSPFNVPEGCYPLAVVDVFIEDFMAFREDFRWYVGLLRLPACYSMWVVGPVAVLGGSVLVVMVHSAISHQPSYPSMRSFITIS